MDPLSTEPTNRRTNKAVPNFKNRQKGRNTIINKLEMYPEIQEIRVFFLNI